MMYGKKKGKACKGKKGRKMAYKGVKKTYRKK